MTIRRLGQVHCTMCWSLDANDVRAARSARKAATETLRKFTNCPETLGAAELVIGELLSNAARHADGYVCLELACADGNIEISVHDTAAAFSLDVRRPPDEFSENGRGLFIISELARKVSVTSRAGFGKRVSVLLELPVDDESTLRPTCISPWLRDLEGVCTRPLLERNRTDSPGARPGL